MADMQPEAQPDLPPLSSMDKLALLAKAEGDISQAIDSVKLAQIGSDVVADYERDERDREDWKKKVERALKAAAQEDAGEKNFPWDGAANVKYPLLTTAALQFNARSYPAIVKGDEPVMCKVIGNDNGLPQIGPDGQQLMQVNGAPVFNGQLGPMIMSPQGMQSLPQGVQPQPMWVKPPGTKSARASRVAQYLSTTLMYRVEGWEEDTDALLLQLPIVGCAFRKVCMVDGELHVSLVPALNLVAPMKAKDVASSPRLTEVIEDVYPYLIAERMASGTYRQVELTPESDDDEAPRTILEQHRLMDMDEDGVPEPYIVTVDKATSEVLRLESNFSMAEAMHPGTRVKKLSVYYVKYDFFPHPKGGFYGIGFGHLLDPITEVVNTQINQLIDAGTAQIAGGGFIAGGVRLQGNSSRVKLKPGEFAVINGVTGTQLREAIFERTVPEPSQVAFQLLDMMLSASKDIASVKDVVTGDASNMGQVGTTMALIEQSLQVFSAIYKRVYRSLKSEFEMVYDCLSRWGGQKAAQDYANVLDDPQANFQTDFAEPDFDIRPVSDPGNVTNIQKMARAQFLQGFLGRGLNDFEIYNRIFEAANIEDISKIVPDASMFQQQMQMHAQMFQAQQDSLQAKTQLDQARAAHAGAGAQKVSADAAKGQIEAGTMSAQVQQSMMGGIPMGGGVQPMPGTMPILSPTMQQARKNAADADKAEMEAEILRQQMASGVPPMSSDMITTRL